MLRKRNAPGPETEGVVCLLGGDIDVFSTAAVRLQHLTRLGFPIHRAALIAPMAFGEARS